MNIEKIKFAIKAGQFSVMEALVKTPPQNMEDFRKQLGFWQGLGEALRVIEMMKEDSDE